MTATAWPRPLLFGHRGAPLSARGGPPLPENTMESFARALEQGATAIETDAHLTADGHVVLSHDAGLERVFGVRLDIRRHTLAEVQRHAPVPTLLDLLRAFPTVPVNVDIKQRAPRMEKAIVDVIEGAGASARVLLASFHTDVLMRVRALGYRGQTSLGRGEIVRLLLLPGPALSLWRVGGARAQVPRRTGRIRFDTRAFIDKCHALGLAVDYWTINDVEEARLLLELGADGIMSDVPGVVRAAFPG